MEMYQVKFGKRTLDKLKEASKKLEMSVEELINKFVDSGLDTYNQISQRKDEEGLEVATKEEFEEAFQSVLDKNLELFKRLA